MSTSTCRKLPTACLAAAIALAAVLPSRVAAAQAEDEAVARALFDEGRRLRNAGDYERACPKFEAAAKLHSGSGILLNLGNCYEHLGRTASAWTKFGEAAAVAQRLGRAADEAEAVSRQAALEVRLSRLTVRVANDAPGGVLKRDGTVLDRAAWGMPIPVDPGKHVVTFEAPGRASWSREVPVIEPGRTVTVDVPDLAPAPPVAGPGPVSFELEGAGVAAPYWNARRVAGVGIAAAGIVTVGVGSGLALGAKSRYDTATRETGSAQRDDSASAVSQGNVATWVFVAGAAVAAAGVVVWLTGAGVAVGTSGRAAWVRCRF